MFNMVKKYVALILLVLIAVTCNYQEPYPPKLTAQRDDKLGPEDVVKAFCKFDARGKRILRSLSDEGNTFYLNIVRWKEESIWDTVILISSYKIRKINRSQDKSQITVEYLVKGKYSPDAIDIYDKNEKVIFLVSKTEGGWRIDGPVVKPHVYPEKMIASLEKRIEQEGDSAKKVKLEKDVSLLKNLKYFTFVKNGEVF